jgi:hypothetical protein
MVACIDSCHKDHVGNGDFGIELEFPQKTGDDQRYKKDVKSDQTRISREKV